MIKMKTTERFEKAVTKLYNAFNEGELTLTHPCYCAVGNICNNNSDWYRETIFLKDFNMFNSVNDENYKTDNDVILKSGYSAYELGEVERVFAIGVKHDEGSKQSQFKGLCAVVEYLCELDGIPNVMDYTALFSNDKKLEEVF